jgi:hypothetical protein
MVIVGLEWTGCQVIDLHEAGFNGSDDIEPQGGRAVVSHCHPGALSVRLMSCSRAEDGRVGTVLIAGKPAPTGPTTADLVAVSSYRCGSGLARDGLHGSPAAQSCTL